MFVFIPELNTLSILHNIYPKIDGITSSPKGTSWRVATEPGLARLPAQTGSYRFILLKMAQTAQTYDNVSSADFGTFLYIFSYLDR